VSENPTIHSTRRELKKATNEENTPMFAGVVVTTVHAPSLHLALLYKRYEAGN
jgi:hypothetical protein